jgi:hypothetical protein
MTLFELLMLSSLVSLIHPCMYGKSSSFRRWINPTQGCFIYPGCIDIVPDLR